MTTDITVSQAYERALQLLKEAVHDNPKRLLKMLFEDLLGIANVKKSNFISTQKWRNIQDAVARLNQGEPLQYVTQMAHFYGLKFFVDKRVLIPRSETEELVYYALEELRKSDQPNLKLLDIGTGSGCIALTIKHQLAGISATAVDLSSVALEVAEINRRNLGISVTLVEDDITNPQNIQIKAGQWDYIVSNPPYIHTSESNLMDTHVINYEPSMALFPADGDPMAMYRSILNYGLVHLTKQGNLFLELNEFLAAPIKNMAIDLGFSKVKIIADMQGKSRILHARRVSAR